MGWALHETAGGLKGTAGETGIGPLRPFDRSQALQRNFCPGPGLFEHAMEMATALELGPLVAAQGGSHLSIVTKCSSADRRFSKWRAPSKLLLLRFRQYGRHGMGRCP